MATPKYLMRDENGSYTARAIADLTLDVNSLNRQSVIGLRPWFTAIANRRNAKASLMVIGDSNGEGQGANAESKRWVSLLRDGLRTRFPTPGVAGGLGYIPAYYESIGMTQSVTVTGSTATKDTRYGLGARCYQIVNTAGLMWPSTSMTSATLHYTKDVAGTDIYLKVDGVQVATVNINGTPTGNSTLATGAVTRGNHIVSVNVNNNGFDGEINGLYIYDQDENAGIHVVDASHYGYTSTSFVASNWWPVATIQPQAILFAMLTNDTLVKTPTQYHTDLVALVSAASAPVTGAYSPIFVAEPPRDATLYQNNAYSDYVAAMADVAGTTTNGVMIDLSQRMPAVHGDTLGFYSDTVHLSVMGHSYQADTLLPMLSPSSTSS